MKLQRGVSRVKVTVHNTVIHLKIWFKLCFLQNIQLKIVNEMITGCYNLRWNVEYINH